MAKTITMSFPHDHDPAEVKRRLTAALADVRAKHPAAMKDARETWTGNRVDFHAAAMGQNVSGFVDIQPGVVNISVTLPFMLGLLANKIRPQVESEARKLLQ